MAYRVRIESFEGPFDLLLYLVNRQKVDIGVISISEIADQYLSEVARMDSLDLDVASDFLVVASTLLEIKAASLLPQKPSGLEEEFEELEPNEARDILVSRLIEYKKFKNAAASLQVRFVSEGRMHARHFGPEEQFLGLMPDFLRNIELEALAIACAEAYARRDTFLLESEHIAEAPIPVETQMVAIYDRVTSEKKLKFSQFVSAGSPSPVIVASFLAILELYKRSLVMLAQEENFGDILIEFIEGNDGLILEDEELTSVGD